MKDRIKFYSEGSDWSYGCSVPELLLKYSDRFDEVNTPEKAQMIIFNGGADIGTSIYGEKPVQRGIPEARSKRDELEINLFNYAFTNKLFVLGICRGAQLVNCLSGGSLWQHVDNHRSDHHIVDRRTGKLYHATSTHHQMMIPGDGAEVIADCHVAKNKFCDNYHLIVNEHFDDFDAEIVWYPKIPALCIQGHPEYVPGSEFSNYCIDLVLEKIGHKDVVEA